VERYALAFAGSGRESGDVSLLGGGDSLRTAAVRNRCSGRVLAWDPSGDGSGQTEFYGESTARPVFSATFDTEPARAAAMAASELRVDPATEPRRFEDRWEPLRHSRMRLRWFQRARARRCRSTCCR